MNVILLISLILAAVSGLFALVRQYQMLQQNSYFPSRYLTWVKDSYSVPLCIECIAFCIASLLMSRRLFTAQLILLIAVLAIRVLICVRTQKKSIKKLVFTGRIKRLFAVVAILFVLFICLYVIFPQSSADGIFATLCLIFSFVSPLTALVCRMLTAPIEKSVSRWYINDAKRILREHSGLTVIGVTGSYGKTSTKYFLAKSLDKTLL